MRTFIFFFLSCFLLPVSADLWFEDVSEPAGIRRFGESWGNAWGDFDGDGYLDLWATNHKQKPSLYRNNTDGTFTDIIDSVWDANPHADTHGVAWADFDNDGDQDLVVLSGGGGGTNVTDARNHNHFYINENGRLTERATEYGIALPLLRGRGPLWFDSNGDGHLDLLITGRVRSDRAGNLVTSSVFQQTPHGFANVNQELGFEVTKDVTLAQLTDITGDGSMEILLDGNPYPGTVYDISVKPFRELTEHLNVPKLLYDVRDAVFADFNGDLLPDAFLTRGIARNYIDTEHEHQIRSYIQVNTGEKGYRFKTRGAVRFEIHSVWATRLHHLSIGEAGHRLTAFNGEFIPNDPVRNVSSFIFLLDPEDPRVVGLKPRPADELWGMYIGYTPSSNEWTILYHTQPDIKTNWTGFEALIEADERIVAVEPVNFSAYDLAYQPRSVLLTSGSERFTPVPTFFGAIDGRSAVAGDFDNDMDVDLYVVRSSSISNFPNYLYENQGDGTFVEVAGAAGAEGSTLGRGQSVTMADYDRDGYLDLFVTNGRGAYPFNDGPDQLFQNISSSGNNWIQIDLQGTVSNRDGIGARLFATTPDGKTQLRENGGGIHWCQQDQKRIHFGLAENQRVSELVIHWPSGIVQKLEDLPVNRVLKVVESDAVVFSADVNQDGRVDTLDFIFVIGHFGEKSPTHLRIDINKDGEINILDLVWIVRSVRNNQASAGSPSHQLGMDASLSLSEADIGVLSAFYEKIEEIPANATHKALVRQFLKEVLIAVEHPLDTRLHANYPNPFNPETWIPYQLATDTDVCITIYNAQGVGIRTLQLGQQSAGYYTDRERAAYWDGRNELGERVVSGIYFYQLETDTTSALRKMVILK
ncbi:T9SS type A sorting domain-containing protein [Candidatus Poribacteria bacterium]|nr:T9SS type A sorting domain-containing protein [Candidatus Poribacteria bacterium]